MCLRGLLPVNNVLTGFTTCTLLEHANIVKIPLDDDILGVHKSSSRTPHRRLSVDAPTQPVQAWEAVYSQGSINPSADIPGGFGFYLSGPTWFATQLADATEAIFSYRMMLEDGWEWAKGGKLPGISGGVGDMSYGCTGGRKEKRCQCFNARAMWRADGVAELYTYLPLTSGNKDRQLLVPPRALENADYGFSVGRGAFNLDSAVKSWVALAFRVKLNDVGVDNGEIELWFEGKSVVRLIELQLRESEESKIRGMHFQTFFGGHTPDWASPKDQRARFTDITGAIIQ
ncbi:polysaccharide lyase family 14 protein [Crepidotus variabilis]|uniref:Polysaccharide lyase family 14 protein n=1 Tax=Crepidotus variabilis TaxID=179855 RepID=A0A9P6E733_9AGAR|nr:polysaccharide lyase family 14 protein [Crepidotus variabilis]